MTPRADDARVPPVRVALLAEAVGLVLAYAGIVLVAPTDAAGRPELTWATSAVGIGTHLAYAALCVVAFRLVNGSIRPSDLGLLRVPWQSAVVIASVGYLAYAIAAAVFVAVFGDPEERELIQALERVDSLALLITIAISACVISPISEELLDRSLLFAAFRRRLGAFPAILVAGLIFGLSHGPPLDGAIQIALLGVTLCAIYHYTGSIIPCMAVHAAHNAFAFAAAAGVARPLALAITVAGIAGTLTVALSLARVSPSPTNVR